ncbi:hypothetical protein GCM10025771_07780 [Niveibacterium umoris]|uniref:Cytochrome-c oxidase n=1 Tax=Niveibacterium umoris TaxID=1193620 RepID=A0A840BK89_9RHOO|nr:cytochrome-c oxidase [Niveibacterium umoris]MBB4013675.1 hypothetical protein [Niveibacterium umoris]
MNRSTQRWILLSLVYFVLAVGLGVGMAATHDFRLRPVHAHLNLLGWVSLALTGWVYSQFPQAAGTRAASAHFWLYNLSLPVMMAGLAALTLGMAAIEPLVAVSSVVMFAAILTFAINVFRHRGAAVA